MGESVCVVQSFTCAAMISHEPDECFFDDNPLDALSESISFGRFMTESLDWGKWSTFSQKKYVEEAEKYSQPGSVAEKKAYFEAHYKKIAAAKKTAAAVLLEEQELIPSENVHEQVVKEHKTEVVEAVAPALNIEKDDKSEKFEVQKDDKSEKDEVVMDDPVAEKEVPLENSTRVADDNGATDVIVLNGMEQVEIQCQNKDNNNKVEELVKKSELIGKNDEDTESLKKPGSVSEKDEDIEPLKKNVPEPFRPSEKCSTPVNNTTVVANHSLPEKTTEKKQVDTRKPATRKWSLLAMCCFKPSASKIQAQKARTEQEIPKKESKKPRCGVCFNSKSH